MPTQDSLFDLLEDPPEQPAPTETPEPPTANPPDVQRRIDALVACRACTRRTGPEWAAFSGGLCMVCAPVDSDDWMAERREARKKATRR